MMQFTDSPMEWMMTQKPKQRREETPPTLSSDHPCYRCGYRKDSCCVGVCYREMFTSSKERRAAT
jgi:hypothetical protein